VLKSSNDAHYEGSNQFLLIVIDTLNSMDVAVLAKAMPSDINKMMLSCMKYGIKSIESISPYCLVIVRLLLILLSQLGEGGFNNKEQVFKPHHIFAMCFSHSNFETMAMKSNDPSRRELISLFICCLALDSPKVVPLQWEKISALLVGYDASLNEDDQLLLRFLFLYERNFGETVSTKNHYESFFSIIILPQYIYVNLNACFHIANFIFSITASMGAGTNILATYDVSHST